MDEYSVPDPAEVEWNISAEGRAWSGEHAHQRHQLTPGKNELLGGKLFGPESDRLRMLGLLLENCGAEAAVRIGDPDVWRRVVASLDDPLTTLRFAVQSALRRRDEMNPYEPQKATRFYEQVTTHDYTEVDLSNSSFKDRAALIEAWQAMQGAGRNPNYSYCRSEVVSVDVEGSAGWAMIREEVEHYRYEQTGPGRWSNLPKVREAVLWREEWMDGGVGWRLRMRTCVERFNI